ncbi:MAG TPA: hypothetical protein VJ729_04605 [Nitrososphaeraceae archaeon]|nr:hypothetical protein [Nitrososphaeraceae archaeon]
MDYNHKRILRIRLLLIESDLRDIISKLTFNSCNSNNNTSNFILYFLKNTIDSKTQDGILAIANCMLGEISQIKEEFGLESEEQLVRSKILGRLNEIWTTLLDTRPERLIGYGSMSDFDIESLKQITSKLLFMLEEIYTLLERQPH